MGNAFIGVRIHSFIYSISISGLLFLVRTAAIVYNETWATE